MASIQINKIFENKSDSEIYEAAIAAIPNAGLKVWKRRDIAHLVMGVGDLDGQEIRCNIAVSMIDSSVTISVDADEIGEDKLNDTAEKLAVEMSKLLG